MATRKKNNADVDLEPWAAYVVGHHPHSLRLCQENLWNEFVHGSLAWSAEDWQKVWTEINELEEALRLLTLGDRVNAAMLVELHRSIDHFGAICREIAASPEEADTSVPRAPGYWDWRDAVQFSARVVTSSPELILWRQLGTAIGRSRYKLGAEPALDTDYIPDELDTVSQTAQALVGLGNTDFVTAIRRTISEIQVKARKQTIEAEWDRIHSRFTAISALDLRLRADLKEREVPEPLLILDRETITFYGETRPLTEFRQGEVACLWVLAEKSGCPVSRDTIIKEGNVDTEPLNLQFFINRVRKNILKPLTEAYSRRHSCARPRGYDVGFIKGQQGRAGSGTGPYRLILEPGRVRIASPRPAWMKPESEP